MEAHAATAGRPIRECARIRECDAEVGIQRLFRKYGLAAHVDVERASLGPEADAKEFPFIKLSSWAGYLLETGRFTKLFCGAKDFDSMRAVLAEFWRRYELQHPDHEVFGMARAGQLELASTVPYFSHSDEGRTSKKEGIFVLSCHGSIGRGTRSYLAQQKECRALPQNQMGLNFLGGSFATQFLIFVMTKRFSNSHPGALDMIVKEFAKDACHLLQDGLVFHGRRIWLLHLNSKGDLPALSKIGSFTRTFWNVARGASSKKASGGICHLCQGGQEQDDRRGLQAVPFEDISFPPCWEPTMHTSLPWEHLPSILEGVPVCVPEQAAFFAMDVWHNFHLGIAKQWIGSSFVVIVESNLLNGSIEAKFQAITSKYKQFCKDYRHSPWVTEISRDSLQWPQSSACPVAKWNKGSASTIVMLFLDKFCQEMIKNKTDQRLLLFIVPWKWDLSNIMFPCLSFQCVFWIFLVCC